MRIFRYGVSHDCYLQTFRPVTAACRTIENTGEIIRFAIGECSLGSILVASSEKGVCCITLGDDPDFLLADLQNRFRKAEFIGGDADFERTRRQGRWFCRSARSSASTCRSISAAPRSNSASGRRCGKFHSGPLLATRMSRRKSATRSPSAPWPGRVRQTPSPSRSRVTASSGRMEISPDTVGAWIGNVLC